MERKIKQSVGTPINSKEDIVQWVSELQTDFNVKIDNPQRIIEELYVEWSEDKENRNHLIMDIDRIKGSGEWYSQWYSHSDIAFHNQMEVEDIKKLLEI